MVRAVGYMKRMDMNLVADALTELSPDRSWGLVRGVGNEHYEAKDGDRFDFKTRWTAVVTRGADDRWRLRAIHFGTNNLDNPVLTKVRTTLTRYGTLGAAAALVVGLVIGVLVGHRAGRRSARPVARPDPPRDHAGRGRTRAVPGRARGGAGRPVMLASAVARGLRARGGGIDAAELDNLDARIRSWWVMVALLAGAAAVGYAGVVALFAVVSWLALRELIANAPGSIRDPALDRTCTALVVSQYALVAHGDARLATVALPLVAPPVLAAVALASGGGRDLGRVSRVACRGWSWPEWACRTCRCSSRSTRRNRRAAASCSSSG